MRILHFRGKETSANKELFSSIYRSYITRSCARLFYKLQLISFQMWLYNNNSARTIVPFRAYQSERNHQ